MSHQETDFRIRSSTVVLHDVHNTKATVLSTNGTVLGYVRQQPHLYCAHHWNTMQTSLPDELVIGCNRSQAKNWYEGGVDRLNAATVIAKLTEDEEVNEMIHKIYQVQLSKYNIILYCFHCYLCCINVYILLLSQSSGRKAARASSTATESLVWEALARNLRGMEQTVSR